MIRRSPPAFSPRDPAGRFRFGVTLLELMCAAAVLSATMLVLVPLLSRVGRVRSHLQAREAVVRELANIVEQVRAGGHPSRAEYETVGRRIVRERLAAVLENVHLTAETASDGDLDHQERVVLTITWNGEQGIAQSIALACWVPTKQAVVAGEVP